MACDHMGTTFGNRSPNDWCDEIETLAGETLAALIDGVDQARLRTVIAGLRETANALESALQELTKPSGATGGS